MARPAPSFWISPSAQREHLAEPARLAGPGGPAAYRLGHETPIRITPHSVATWLAGLRLRVCWLESESEQGLRRTTCRGVHEPQNKGMKLTRSAPAREPRPLQLIPGVGPTMGRMCVTERQAATSASSTVRYASLCTHASFQGGVPYGLMRGRWADGA